MWADDDFCRVSKVGYDGKCGRTVHFGVKHPGSVVVVVVVVVVGGVGVVVVFIILYIFFRMGLLSTFEAGITMAFST